VVMGLALALAMVMASFNGVLKCVPEKKSWMIQLKEPRDA